MATPIKKTPSIESLQSSNLESRRARGNLRGRTVSLPNSSSSESVKKNSFLQVFDHSGDFIVSEEKINSASDSRDSDHLGNFESYSDSCDEFDDGYTDSSSAEEVFYSCDASENGNRPNSPIYRNCDHKIDPKSRDEKVEVVKEELEPQPLIQVLVTRKPRQSSSHLLMITLIVCAALMLVVLIFGTQVTTLQRVIHPVPVPLWYLTIVGIGAVGILTFLTLRICSRSICK